MKQQRHIRHYRNHIRLINPDVNKRFKHIRKNETYITALMKDLEKLPESEKTAILIFIDDQYPELLKYAESLDFQDLKMLVKDLLREEKRDGFKHHHYVDEQGKIQG